ncbi:MAG: Sir2 family NAD-dependent protein deacetylase [Candidatus Brocadiales bacterium]
MSTDSNSSGGIEKAAAIIKQSRAIVALTGAGISTSAGIPDFRSPSEGLWAKDPSKMMLFTDVGFAGDPRGFYEFGREVLLPNIQNARPTPAHRFLARLGEKNSFGLGCVITQNIDGLHQRAGSGEVIEVHGGLSTGRCTASACTMEFTLEQIAERMEEELPPRCPECGSVIRPNIVLFGETLPEEAYKGAVQYLRDCDLLLVMGSSLVVYPAADLPGIALGNGAGLIIMNLQPTQYDAQADVVIHSSLDDVAGRLAGVLGITL